MKSHYLLNSFYFQKQLFEKYLNEEFIFHFSPPVFKTRLRAIFYIPYNILCLIWLYWTGKIKCYQVIHFNRVEAFWLWRRIPGQVTIFEVHGFDVGVRGELYLRDLHSKFKYRLGMLIDRLITKRIIKNIQQVDLFYCSTPDLVEPIAAWCGRKPLWLPNPIDVDLFTSDGPVAELSGQPACFLAARLHGDKKPEVAIDIFQKFIKPKYPGAVLHLLETGELVAKYKRELANDQSYVWHGFMDKSLLASVIRGADLVFGDFSIGALGLLPMQVMACKRPIVTLDHYEIIKTPIEELPDLAIKLLYNEHFRNEFVGRNYDYIFSTHAPAAACGIHLRNLREFIPEI